MYQQLHLQSPVCQPPEGRGNTALIGSSLLEMSLPALGDLPSGYLVWTEQPGAQHPEDSVDGCGLQEESSPARPNPPLCLPSHPLRVPLFPLSAEPQLSHQK